MKKIVLMFVALFLIFSMSLFAQDKPEYLYARSTASWTHNLAADVIDTNWCTAPVDFMYWDVTRLRLLMKWTQHQCDSTTAYTIMRSMDGINYYATSYADTVYSSPGTKDNTAAQMSLLIPRDSCLRFMRARVIMQSHADDSGAVNECSYIWEGWKP